ncbi:hypothetical protein AB9P05_06630 [Roseivirga sp. BDSF3-8]|uniref:hypothetical protein n=1 Tax=Roseivirga sp. BDSF3-8 TaxID=3241598 RepID=UPI003531EC19
MGTFLTIPLIIWAMPAVALGVYVALTYVRARQLQTAIHNTRAVMAATEKLHRGLAVRYYVQRKHELKRTLYRCNRSLLEKTTALALVEPQRKLFVHAMRLLDLVQDLPVEEVLAVKDAIILTSRGGKAMQAMRHLLHDDIVAERGIYGSVNGYFRFIIKETLDVVEVYCSDPDRRYPLRVEEDITLAVLQVMMHMIFDRTPTAIVVHLDYYDDRIEATVRDNDPSEANVDLWGANLPVIPDSAVYAIRMAKEYNGYSDMVQHYTEGLCLRLVVPV